MSEKNSFLRNAENVKFTLVGICGVALILFLSLPIVSISSWGESQSWTVGQYTSILGEFEESSFFLYFFYFLPVVSAVITMIKDDKLSRYIAGALLFIPFLLFMVFNPEGFSMGSGVIFYAILAIAYLVLNGLSNPIKEEDENKQTESFFNNPQKVKNLLVGFCFLILFSLLIFPIFRLSTGWGPSDSVKVTDCFSNDYTTGDKVVSILILLIPIVAGVLTIAGKKIIRWIAAAILVLSALYLIIYTVSSEYLSIGLGATISSLLVLGYCLVNGMSKE